MIYSSVWNDVPTRIAFGDVVLFWKICCNPHEPNKLSKRVRHWGNCMAEAVQRRFGVPISKLDL